MKNIEALVDEIVKQRKIDALMQMKKQKLSEIKDINTSLRKLIYNK